MGKIFCSIAAMLDPMLISTIEDMISKAKNPENLVFGVCIQDTEERIAEFDNKYKNRDNFRILRIKPEDSKGCCWARAKVQQLMGDEEYFFQSDSHHRYIKDWDQVCIDMLKRCQELSKIDKVVLSTYATPVSYTHLTLPTNRGCRSRWSPYH